jgi:hypothetical protein
MLMPSPESGRFSVPPCGFDLKTSAADRGPFAHRRQVRAGSDKVLAHTDPSRVPRNYRGIDAGPSGHVLQKAGNLSCFEG